MASPWFKPTCLDAAILLCTTNLLFLCAARRFVGQAILPAAGFRAGSALDVQSRPAGWKAGCSQDWLPHLAAKARCATKSSFLCAARRFVVVLKTDPGTG